MRVLEYLDEAGRRPFAAWFDRLDPKAAIKVTVALSRIELGKLSSAKPIGGALFEYRIDFGPGYRIYFGRDGDELVILLGGGTKKRQYQDIETAQIRWNDYKRRKREQQWH
jgi:putative addiction module killer protein